MPAVISDASVSIRDFTGTVGVLLRDKREGKLSALKPVLDQLIQQHSFRLSRNLYQALLRQAGEAL